MSSMEIYKYMLANFNVTKPAMSITDTFEDSYTFLSEPNHEFLTGSHPRKTYVKQSVRGIVHYGQLKLYLTCLQFLTKYWDPFKHPRPKMVYVGAAPCCWIILLARQFPLFEFHLYDPSPFDKRVQEYDQNDTKLNVKKSPNFAEIYLYKRLFVDEDVEQWRDQSDVFFVSDIRPMSYNKKSPESESVVHESMTLQSRWIKSIKPVFSQVKFKLPYSENYHEERNSKPIYVYLQGKIYFQQWVGPLSTEARLVSEPPYVDTDYNYQIYEEMMFHHNTCERNPEVTRYRNILDGSSGPYPELSLYGIYNDLDSTMTVKIIKEYLEKVKDTDDKVTEKQIAEFFRDVDVELEIGNSDIRKQNMVNPKNYRLLDRRA